MIRLNNHHEVIQIDRYGHEASFDFNLRYHGLYPACQFTAVGHLKDWDYLAGTDAQGVVHLFAGNGGEVWEERNITARFSSVRPGDYGSVVSIMAEEKWNQIFLLTENGYLVTVPSCPKCVLVQRISDEKLCGGGLNDDSIYYRDINGSEKRFYTSAATQFRCSWAYARSYLPDRGVLLDLREKDSRDELPVQWAIPFDENRIEALKDAWPREKAIFLFCERGFKADRLVWELRERGCRNAYSLGGEGDMLLEEAEAAWAQA